jgi:LysM repeat protein
VNPVIDSACSNLGIGQILCLGTLGADCIKTYTVVPDDVCESVAEAYGIDLPLLYANNPILDVACDNLYIGEVVCVDNKYNVPSLAANQTKPVPPPNAVPALPYCDEI